MYTRNSLLALIAGLVATAALMGTSALSGGHTALAAKPPAPTATPANCAAASRIAYTVRVGTDYDLFAANPNGSCVVRLTTGNSAFSVWDWTADNYILVRSLTGASTLLSVPNSANAGTVSTYFSTSGDVGPISQHRNASGVLPVGQQLYAVDDGENISVCTINLSSCTQLTSYVSDYVSGGTGTDYDVSNVQWLPPSADRSRIRIAYHFRQVFYVNGVGQSGEWGRRILSLSTAGWPAIGTSGMTDKWVIGKDDPVGGYLLSDYAYLTFSRDGTKAATLGPSVTGGNLNGIWMLPVSYDETADTVTIDTAGAFQAATGFTGRFNDHAKSFSPDSSQIAFTGSTLVGKGGNQQYVSSIWSIGSSATTGAVQVDGQSTAYSCCPIWGPGN